MVQCGASVIPELTQWSGSLTHLASDHGQVHQKYVWYNNFLGGLRHSPPRMKNQHGLNEEKNHIGKKIVSHILSVCDVTRVVSLVTNNLKHKVCESGEKSC
jgi:hypothetical protein